MDFARDARDLARYAEIFGFIRAAERYLADMAERGDHAAAILCGDAGIIMAAHGEEIERERHDGAGYF
jgi:hypothetical protein